MSMPLGEWYTTLLGTGCLVISAAFMKYITESNNVYPSLHKSVLHINIDFHYKAKYNYHQLVSLLF